MEKSSFPLIFNQIAVVISVKMIAICYFFHCKYSQFIILFNRQCQNFSMPFKVTQHLFQKMNQHQSYSFCCERQRCLEGNMVDLNGVFLRLGEKQPLFFLFIFLSQLELKWAEDCRMCPTYLYEAVTYALDAAAALFYLQKPKSCVTNHRMMLSRLN